MAYAEVVDLDVIDSTIFNRLQVGSTGAVTTDANGDIFVTFPLPYTAKPAIVGTRKTTGSSQYACHVSATSTTGCTFTITDDDALQISTGSVVVHWAAMGELA